jgi:hypothetical protein
MNHPVTAIVVARDTASAQVRNGPHTFRVQYPRDFDWQTLHIGDKVVLTWDDDAAFIQAILVGSVQAAAAGRVIM